MQKSDIIKDIKIKIPEQEVLRYLGYQKEFIHQIDCNIKSLIQEEITHTYPLLENRGLYRFLVINSISDSGMSGMINTQQGYRFSVNQKVTDLLKNSEYLLFAVVTIGSKIEKIMKERFNQDKYLEAIVLDAVGTVAVKTVGQWLNHFIEQKGLEEGFTFTRYFEPGSGDWDIQEQKRVFQILSPERIGIRLNTSYMMTPAKSLSWVRGMGHHLINTYRDAFSCEYCLLEHCPFRKI